MDDRVVVGYDASQESSTAVRWAARTAERLGWALDVVHVWGFAGQEGGGAGSSWLGMQVRAAVEEVAEEGAALARQAAPGVVAEACVEHGSAAGVLVDRARHARLMVLGRHGAGRFAGALIGSVTSGVLHHAACPVVVVPEGAEDLPEDAPVLVGFDGSSESFGALEAACDQARLRGTALTVVTAWTAAAETSRPTYWAAAYPSRAPGEVAVAEGERTLDRARSWFTPQHDLTVTFDLAEGRAQEVLVRRSRHAGLMVVGTRGRGGFTSLVLGSVSRAVVHRAHCPVLVTRAPRAVQEALPPDEQPVVQEEQVPRQGQGPAPRPQPVPEHGALTR